MASFVKKGVRLAKDLNAMLAAPDNSHTPQNTNFTQQPYPALSPSPGLSPYFPQQQSTSHYQGTYAGSSPYQSLAQYVEPQVNTPQPGHASPYYSVPPTAVATTPTLPSPWQSSAGVSDALNSTPAATPNPGSVPTPLLSPPLSTSHPQWPSAESHNSSVHDAPQYHQPVQSQWLTSQSITDNISRSSSPVPPTYHPPQSAPPQLYSSPQSVPAQPYCPPQSAPPPTLETQDRRPTYPQHHHSAPVVVQNSTLTPPIPSATKPQIQPVAHVNNSDSHFALPTASPFKADAQPQPFDMSPMSQEISLLNQAAATSPSYNLVQQTPPVAKYEPQVQYNYMLPGTATSQAIDTNSMYYAPSLSLDTISSNRNDAQLQLRSQLNTPQPQWNQVIVPRTVLQPAKISSSFREIPQFAPTVQQPSVKPTDQPAASVLRVQTNGHAATARKILCLDGGGVRGLASLLIVKHLIDRLEMQRGGRLEPWQEFDMIAGTSTGGLIAIMLGRLCMPVDQCIEVYQRLSRKIFTPVHSKANVTGRAVAKFRAEGKFESEPLEEYVKQMCRERNLSESELLRNDGEDEPKVFVCAVQGSNSDSVVIRSYRSATGEWDDLYSICKIWEAARATAAASTFFDPIKIGHQRYVDGGLRYNNPIEKADEESRALWPNDDRIIISIGTGCAPGPKLLGDAMKLIQTLAKIVTDSEEENVRFRRRNSKMIDDGRLYRFNVLHGLADVKLDEWEALEDIRAHTSTYLRSPDTAREFQKCATTLKEVGQRLGYIAGEELEVHQKIQQLSAVYTEFCEDCHKAISYSEKMFFCLDCQMYTCTKCNDFHDRDHIRRMLRFDLTQWMPKMPGIKPTTSCRYCAKDTKTRWECTSCGWALCLGCVSDYDRRIEFFTDHRASDPDGRFFVAVYPPYWSTTSQWVIEKCPCLDMSNSTNVHCDRCHKVFTHGDRGYWCKICHTDFGGGQDICQECFEQVEEHRNKHQFGTVEFVTDSTVYDSFEEAEKTMWGCSQCPERFPMGRQFFHSHLHLKFFVSPLFTELARKMCFQTCHRKEAQSALKVQTDPAPVSCDVCGSSLAFGQAGSMCLQSGCDTQLCSSCSMTRRSWHRHHLYDIVVQRPPQNYMAQVACSYCSTAYIVATAQGLWCADCNRHYMCIVCLDQVAKVGGAIVPEGLPHQKILKPCKVKNGWIFYLTG